MSGSYFPAVGIYLYLNFMFPGIKKFCFLLQEGIVHHSKQDPLIVYILLFNLIFSRISAQLCLIAVLFRKNITFIYGAATNNTFLDLVN